MLSRMGWFVNICRPVKRLLIVSWPLVLCQQPACARFAASARSPAAYRLILASLLVGSAAGCAALHRRPVAEDVAAGRDFTQQGVTAMETGRWSDAEILLQRAVEASPDDAVARRHLAEALWQRGATDAALEQIERAVELEPDDAALVVRRGEMRLGNGDSKRGLACAEEAIALNPKSAEAWALRGRAFWQMNQTDRALADLQRSLEFEPDRRDVLMDIGAIYRQRGEHERCLTTLQYLLDTYPPGQGTQLAYWMEGLTLADLGRSEQAAQSLQAAAERGPANADLLYYLAQAHLAAGHADQAATAAQAALVANPAHAASRRLVAELAAHSPATAPLVR